MQFCQDHWDRIRQAVADRGLEALVPDSGERAAEQMARAASGEDTVDTFDPLMFAHWAIVTNVFRVISEVGSSPLYLMGSGPEDPVPDDPDGRTFPRCPLCYLNLEHELGCKGCELPRETGFDFMIDRAADDSLNHWKELSDA